LPSVQIDQVVFKMLQLNLARTLQVQLNLARELFTTWFFKTFASEVT